MNNKKKSTGGTAIPSAEENKIISMPIIDQAKEKIKTSAKTKLNNKANAIEKANKPQQQFASTSPATPQISADNMLDDDLPF